MKTAPVNMGDTGVFTVSVTPTTATGTVTLWDAAGPRTAATSVATGTATIQFPWPQAGSTSLYAVYSGDNSNASSSSTPVSFTVQKALPQVKLVAPASASSDAQVSLNATVISANSQLTPPTGVVEFWDSLNSGTAQLLTAQNLTSGPGGTSVYATRVKLAPGSHSLYAHYRGDTNWQPADSTPVPLVSSSFTVSVSPAIIGIAAGSPGTGTVTVTPSGGFSGAVSLTCGTGGTFVPAGYTCTFGQASLPVNNAVATTTLNLTPMSASASAVKRAGVIPPSNSVWAVGFAAGILLFGIFGFAVSTNTHNRNFFLACGLVFCVGSIVLGCGGGGGGSGGGPVSTTTTISSSNLKVAFGMPVTFTVKVTPNGAATPSGAVQLYDNGQAYGSPVNVSAGIASFLSTSLPVGVHNLTADYRGDSGTQASTSAPISQAITGTIGLQISGAANGITETADFTVAVN